MLIDQVNVKYATMLLSGFNVALYTSDAGKAKMFIKWDNFLLQDANCGAAGAVLLCKRHSSYRKWREEIRIRLK